MADSPKSFRNVRVRDLIAAYEYIGDQPEPDTYRRPRAKSVGNVLNPNVVVRSNEFLTLEDIDTALSSLERDLNAYNVYSKEEHVALQERLFSLLTSLVNIESHEKDEPTKKKKLITKTKSLVSFLNQKLPSASGTTDKNKFKYTTYSSYIESIHQNNLEANSTIDTVDASSEKHKINHTKAPAPKSEKHLNLTKDTKERSLESKLEDDPSAGPNLLPSVSRLRGLFEESTKRSNTGLEVLITSPRPSISTGDIPYIDSNLTNHRYKRLMSGSYMDYTRLLRSTDINRSRSTHDLSNNLEVESTGEVKPSQKAGSDISETSSEDSIESVREVRLERDISVEEIPVNIVQNTKRAYENVPEISQHLSAHRTETMEPEVLAKKEWNNNPIYENSKNNELFELLDTIDVQIGTTHPQAIEDPDEIPQNIVQRTRRAYEKVQTGVETNIPVTESKRYEIRETEALVNMGRNNVMHEHSKDTDETVQYLESNDVPDGTIYPQAIEDPDEIPQNIVLRTRRAYEKVDTSGEKNISITKSEQNEIRKPEVPIKIEQSNNLAYEDSNNNETFESLATNDIEIGTIHPPAIEDPDEIPQNIVQRTRRAYENVDTAGETNVLFTTTEPNGRSTSEHAVEKPVLMHESSEEAVPGFVQAEAYDIKEDTYVIEEPDDIPQNIVQRTRRAYEGAVNKVGDKDSMLPPNDHNIPANSVEGEEIYSFTTPQVSEENPQYARFENEDMQDEGLKNYNTTEIDEIPENIVQRTMQVYEDSVLDTPEEYKGLSLKEIEQKFLYCTDETGESKPETFTPVQISADINEDEVPQFVRVENDDMIEEHVEYSSAAVQDDEILTNIAEITVDADQQAILEQNAAILEQDARVDTERESSDSPQKIDNEKFIEEEIKYSKTLSDSEDDYQSSDETFSSLTLTNGGDSIPTIIVEENIPYATSLVNIDGMASRVDRSEEDPKPAPRLLMADNIDIENYITYPSGDIIEELDDEALKNAEEEFEKLIGQE